MVASSRSQRLPLMALQHAIKKDEAEMETSLSDFFQDPETWRTRVNFLVQRGITEGDLDHWLWILEAKTIDTKIKRFLSTDRHKPIFLLLALLHKDDPIAKGSSLVGLFDYVARTYLGPEQKYGIIPREEEALPQSLDNAINMGPSFFCLLIKRLTHQCMQVFPTSIVAVARLAVDYIRAIPDVKQPRKSNRRTGYVDCCMVFNYAMCQFKRTPPSRPLQTMRFNWRAQRILLGFSAGLRRPLVIDRPSYRAIRTVLMGLKKSQAEKRVAFRLVKTWPPYRKNWDGTDEARAPEDDLSRSIKAGILKREEGYSDDISDHALSVLGGATYEHGTVQTRSRSPRLWRGPQMSLNMFSDWAMRVKATRNSHEAWQIFLQSPSAGTKPNYQVYAEMFAKLFAKEVTDPDTGVPGDSKEVFPPYEFNLTEFELARLKPDGVDELYARLLRDGNRPVHNCLRLLVLHATSLSKALRYLQDSPLDRDAVMDMTSSSRPSYDNLQKIPIPIFDAYIALLCRLQPRRRWETDRNAGARREVPSPRYDFVNRAVQLVGLRLGGWAPSTEKKTWARPQKRAASHEAWHIVMRTLANNKLVLKPHLPQWEDDVEVLSMFVTIYYVFRDTQGLNPVAFDCLGRCLSKVLRHGRGVIRSSGRSLEVDKLSWVARMALKKAFKELTTPVKTGPALSEYDLPPLYHEISGGHIHSYIKTLSRLEDVDEMVHVIKWVLQSWDEEQILENARDPEHKQYISVSDAFIFFRAFAEKKVSPAVLEWIEKKFQELNEKGSPWVWPSDYDVEEFMSLEQSDHAARFWASLPDGGPTPKDPGVGGD